MRTTIGFSQRVKRAWLDALLDQMTQSTDEAELRSFLDQHLAAEIVGPASRANVVGILLRIWCRIPAARLHLRERALNLLPHLPGSDRIWLHWGMVSLAYPFFRDAAEVIGRLQALQDDFTTAQVQSRLLTVWGDRVTTRDAARRLLNTLTEWEVLRHAREQSQFLPARKLSTDSCELQLWLLETLLSARPTDEIEAQQLLRLPESFPFTISVALGDLRRHSSFDLHRQGLDTDLVALRVTRFPEELRRDSAVPSTPRTPLPSSTARHDVAVELPEEAVPTESQILETPSNLIPEVAARDCDSEIMTAGGSAPSTPVAEPHCRVSQNGEPLGTITGADTGPQSVPPEVLLAHFTDWAKGIQTRISETLKRDNSGSRERDLEHLLSDIQQHLATLKDLSSTPRAEGMPGIASEVVSQKFSTLPESCQTNEAPTREHGSPGAELTVTQLKALSVRQPHAEAIMRGLKTMDVRSMGTRFRGRILIYASLGRLRPTEELGIMNEYGIQDVTAEDLPRGVLIGTVELYDSNGGQWFLRSPERLAPVLKPAKQPKPVWFNPF